MYKIKKGGKIMKMKIQAENILLKANIKIEYFKTFLEPSKYGKAQQYRIVLSKPDMYYATDFTDSIYNTQNNKKLNLDDVIYCLLNDCNVYDNTTDLQDFADQFGYNKISELFKAYNGCKETSENLHKLFTNEQLKELQTIYQDY